MTIVTYFVFTILSIFIQFCVMDFIQGNFQIAQKPNNLKSARQKTQFNNIMKNKNKLNSNALFYNIHASGFTWNNAVVPDLELMTSTLVPTLYTPSSIIDFYEENSSTKEFSTDTTFTNSEVDNITEITLFNANNTKEIVPVRKYNKECRCNFLYNICDINCCCDYDCSDEQRKIFSCPNKNDIVNKSTKTCYHFLPQNNIDQSNIFNNLFCIVKTNLPEKRIVKQEKTKLENFYKWTKTFMTNSLRGLEFNKNDTNQYIWILNKESVHYLDIPTTFVNNYCMDRHPVKQLQRIKSICIVNLNHLEMFHILNTFEEGFVVSPVENTTNSSTLNCSTLFCASSNIMACNNDICVTYNKSIHEPMCTENVCTNMVLKVKYFFNYNKMKITNVTIKLYMENISMAVLFVTQEINIDFIMGNITEENLIEFSGSPGYLTGRPIIISQQEKNRTEHFYKQTDKAFYFRRPDNKNGICTLNNNSDNFIEFGINKRSKCRFAYTKGITIKNYTHICLDIQENIKVILYLIDNTFVSPYGNPMNIKDDDWLKIKKKDDSPCITGEIDLKTSRLNCFNMRTSVSFVFAYENMVNENGKKLLHAEYELITQNKSFDIEDVSCTVTVDVFFADLSTHDVEEYAGVPYANIGLPQGFFSPFPSNRALNTFGVTVYQISIYYVFIFAFK